MLLGLATATLVLGALVWELYKRRLVDTAARVRATVRSRRFALARERARAGGLDFDPGRERRAEQRARELLRSCVSGREWAMYRDLGFISVPGGSGGRYAYLLYPHKPLVAYVPATGALLNEYCVVFADHSRPYGSARLPDADDVLAKWMALAADERGLIDGANMHLPGRQVDPGRVARDLSRLARWERERAMVLDASAAGEAEAIPTERGGAPTEAEPVRGLSVAGPLARHAGLGAGSVRAA